MQSKLIIATASALAIGIASAQVPAQVQRGQALFEKSPKGVACATCHKIKNIGTAVAPDLMPLAAAVGSHGLVKTIQMESTEYVQDVKTADGKTFPASRRKRRATSCRSGTSAKCRRC